MRFRSSFLKLLAWFQQWVPAPSIHPLPGMNESVLTLLAAARRRLHALGADTSHLESLASTLDRIAYGERSEVLAQLHDTAGRLPYVDDSDFGALLLESYADEATRLAWAGELLKHASYRAKWCAQAAGSGGEGMARSIDLQRIQAKRYRLAWRFLKRLAWWQRPEGR